MIKFLMALGISILILGGLIAYYVIAWHILEKIERKKSMSWEYKPFPDTKITAEHLNKLGESEGDVDSTNTTILDYPLSDDGEVILFFVNDKDEVNAWMSLPEPYKEGESE